MQREEAGVGAAEEGECFEYRHAPLFLKSPALPDVQGDARNGKVGRVGHKVLQACATTSIRPAASSGVIVRPGKRLLPCPRKGTPAMPMWMRMHAGGCPSGQQDLPIKSTEQLALCATKQGLTLCVTHSCVVDLDGIVDLQLPAMQVVGHEPFVQD